VPTVVIDGEVRSDCPITDSGAAFRKLLKKSTLKVYGIPHGMVHDAVT